MSAYAMHLAGYLPPTTVNDWATVAYCVAVLSAVVWVVFREGGR